MKNPFLKAVHSFFDGAYKNDTTTENGAISHSTTNSGLLDYFSKAGTYRDRSKEEVFADMGKIWAESPLTALQIIFYNRLITRQIKGNFPTEKVQKGQGARSEFRLSVVWLAKYQPAILSKNLWLIPLVGTWKDLWHADLIAVLDRQSVYELIKINLTDEYQAALLAKYLPRIRSKSNTHNERHEALNQFAFGLIKFLEWTPQRYRKFKASGAAHEFQRKMCANEWDALDFKTFPGKALFQLVNKKGKDTKTTIERHAIEAAYVDWIKTQPTAKFTGYVYQLMGAVNARMSLAQKITVDKQFDGLIELAKQDVRVTENVWCALDTSGSMGAEVGDTTAFNICISLGVYFSSLNEGAFKDHVIMFDNVSKLKKLQGSFTDKVLQITAETTAWGSTNFQSVIDEVVRVRQQNPSIPLSAFPTTLVVVSDMQFNPVDGGNVQTNYEAAMRKLRAVGLPKMRIVWWWVTGRGGDFPSKMNDKGVIMIGGFDGSIISLLIGEEVSKKGTKPSLNITPFEAMQKALNQEILTALRI